MKRIIIAILCMFSACPISACDICGCGVGNFYMGLLPNFKNHFIGLRYQYVRYHTQLTGDATQFSNDRYRTIEIWSGWNIGKKWQVITFVPYQINKQVTDDGIKNNQGIGDVTVIANYALVHTRNARKDGNMVDQQLSIGGGITLPTGRFNVETIDPSVPGEVNSQNGTGSTNFIVDALYTINVNNIGFNASANYKVNTPNKMDFKYGNRFTANAVAWYRLRSTGFGISPNIGVSYEHSAFNQLTKSAIDQTGGNALLGTAGVEINHNKIAVGLNAQLPFTQNFSEGQTQIRSKGLVHVTLSL